VRNFIVFLLSFFLWPLLAFAKIPHVPFHGIETKLVPVAAAHGAVLAAVELLGNDGNEVVVLQPGLIEAAETLDEMAAHLHHQGFKVIIMQSRVAGRGPRTSIRGAEGHNGLRDVLLSDTQALWDHVLSHYSNGEPFHVIGHSMGGIQIMATLGNPEGATRYAGKIKSVNLVTAPHNFKNLPGYVQTLGKHLDPLLKKAMALGFDEIVFHHKLFGLTWNLKNGGLWRSRAARTLERIIATPLTRFFQGILINGRFTSRREMRRMMRQEISPIPIQLISEIIDAALSGELPVPVDLSLLTMPTQVITAEYDQLVAKASQRELFMSLTESIRSRWIMIVDGHHVDPVVSLRLSAVLLPHISSFMKNPFSQMHMNYIEIGDHLPSTWEKCMQILQPSALQANSGTESVSDFTKN
jgi:pimeloyl-ACP methyl ester carboxylesterase